MLVYIYLGGVGAGIRRRISCYFPSDVLHGREDSDSDSDAESFFLASSVLFDVGFDADSVGECVAI
jgi:hypothetical protein